MLGDKVVLFGQTFQVECEFFQNGIGLFMPYNGTQYGKIVYIYHDQCHFRIGKVKPGIEGIDILQRFDLIGEIRESVIVLRFLFLLLFCQVMYRNDAPSCSDPPSS